MRAFLYVLPARTAVVGAQIYKSTGSRPLDHIHDFSDRYRRDPRNPAAPLRMHSCTHSDDVTAVHFMRSNHVAPGLRNVLLSASTDGLVCTSNADEPDEDEALLHAANWGCSVAQAGWIHGYDATPGVWASSDMETFSTWSGEVTLPLSVFLESKSG